MGKGAWQVAVPGVTRVGHDLATKTKNQMGKQWKQSIFLGSKITADGDCSHEIKRILLLGRKDITNIDSIVKNKDVTLPTKVRIVKVMVFPVVMYGFKSWTIKKVEC